MYNFSVHENNGIVRHSYFKIIILFVTSLCILNVTTKKCARYRMRALVLAPVSCGPSSGARVPGATCVPPGRAHERVCRHHARERLQHALLPAVPQPRERSVTRVRMFAKVGCW